MINLFQSNFAPREGVVIVFALNGTWKSAFDRLRGHDQELVRQLLHVPNARPLAIAVVDKLHFHRPLPNDLNAYVTTLIHITEGRFLQKYDSVWSNHE